MALSRDVSEIFSIEKCRDLEIGIRVHSRSLKMIPLNPAPMTSYHSIVTIGLSRTVSAINGDFRRKSPVFPTPVYFAPPEGVTLGFGYRRRGQKDRNDGLPDGRKSFKKDLAV